MALLIQLLLNFWFGYLLKDTAFLQFKKIALWLMPLLVPAIVVIRLAMVFILNGTPDPGAVAFNSNYFIGQGGLFALAVVMQLLFHFSLFKALRRARRNQGIA